MAITEGPRAPFWRRLLWMVGIWAASVAALAVLAGGLRLLFARL